jgi:hypothetical protein
VNDQEGARSRRVLRFAVLGSLLVHAIGFFLWGATTDRFVALQPKTRQTPPPDIVVSISHATTISKHARPVPVRPSHPVTHPPAPASRETVAEQQQPAAQPIPRRPALEVPRALRELAKPVPKIDVNPPRTIRATPSPFPQTPVPQSPAPRTLALRTEQSRSSAVKSQRHLLSQAQLATIGQDLQKTLTELRREDDPLAVRSTAAPAAPKRIRVQMLGADSGLKHGQGIYYPIKSWSADGFNYYYCAYQFVYADGIVETGGVPWPVRFPPAHDPFVHPEIGERGEAPLAGPLPGWKLPPGEKIGKALTLAVPGLPAESQ